VANRKNTEIDSARTSVWLEVLYGCAETTSPDAIERRVSKELQLRTGDAKTKAKSGNLRAYLRKGSKPYQVGTGPALRAAIWPERIAKVWPSTLPWLLTPFWYFCERPRLSLEELVQCAKLLPERYRDELFAVDSEEVSPEQRLNVVHPYMLYEISRTPSAWSIAAMACAMRRAEISGDARCAHLAGAGLAWLLYSLMQARVSLEQALNFILLLRADATFGPGLCRPIQAVDLARFDVDREVFFEWDPLVAGKPHFVADVRHLLRTKAG